MLLEVKDLHTYFRVRSGTVKAVEGIGLFLHPGEILGLVGESGCGKTVTALSVMRLLPDPLAVEVKGEVLLEGRDLLRLNRDQMRRIRGREISMIFQEPSACLNPVFTVGDQLAEVMRVHERMGPKPAKARSLEMLQMVRLPDGERILREYPHHLSGGMCQRVMIAMALACNPRILIADEPTTALDVTIQAQILDLLERLKEQLQTSILLITHDLGIVAQVAQRVAVVYAGRIVEEMAAKDLFPSHLHPYTEGLLRSIPPARTAGTKSGRLSAIPGAVPDLSTLTEGCKFHSRCQKRQAVCEKEEPALNQVAPGHGVRCFFPG